MPESIEMFKDELTATLSRLRKINKTLLKEDGGGNLHHELQKEQQNILLVQIPSLKAKIRRAAEVKGDLQEESARFCPVFTDNGDNVICTSASYLLGGDVYWNVNPRVVGTGKDKHEAVLNFCSKIRHIMDRRHGRPVKMMAQTASQFREALCANG